MAFYQTPESKQLERAIERACEADRKDVKGKAFTTLLKKRMDALKKKHKAEMQEMINDLHKEIYGTTKQ